MESDIYELHWHKNDRGPLKSLLQGNGTDLHFRQITLGTMWKVDWKRARMKMSCIYEL